jgi:hypothetical protein
MLVFLGLTHPAAVLEFFTALAWTGVVATDLRDVTAAHPGKLHQHLLLLLAKPVHELGKIPVEIVAGGHDQLDLLRRDIEIAQAYGMNDPIPDLECTPQLVPTFIRDMLAHITYLRPMSVTEISDQRNAIHYRPHDWLFDDLHIERSILEFFHLTRDDDEAIILDSSTTSFSLVLAVIVLHMAVLLFQSLAELSNALADELSLLQSALNRASHLIYRRATEPSIAWAN